MSETPNPFARPAAAASTLRSIADLCDMPGDDPVMLRRRLDDIRAIAIERAERLEGLPRL